MCGIAGVVSFNRDKFDPVINKMLSSIQHRGPDASTSTSFPNCWLGHVRLSIVDINSGSQPMFSKCKSKAIVFNGEIYGFQQLKNNISYPYLTQSDTEVLLAMYEQNGHEMLSQLPGMFAFGIWNQSKNELFCARDRFGEKPFYYAFSQTGELIFASEIKAIIASGLVDPEISPNAVAHYLHKLYTHPEETIYKNIFCLPPAHALSFSENGGLKIWQYWQLPHIQQQITMHDALDEFKELMQQAVERQLVADVPVSAFLSGGLDSSTIVSIASKLQPNLETFSLGFGSSTSELPLAKETARKLGTKHTELCIDDFRVDELIFEMQNVYDEPFGDSSNIPTFLISKEASKHTKVALTGDGGDELLGGYANWYRPLLAFAKQLEEGKQRQMWKYAFAKMIYRSMNLSYLRPVRYFENDLFFPKSWKQRGMEEFHSNHAAMFTKKEISRIVDNAQIRKYRTPQTSVQSPSVAMEMDLLNYLPGDLLVKTDRAAMANSLELRAPFLDVDFASFCISLPYQLKITNTDTKHILRLAYKEQWTKAVASAPKKGFGAPVNEWLQQRKMSEIRDEFLRDKTKRVFDFISFEKVQPYVLKNNTRTWTLLNLAIWMQKHA